MESHQKDANPIYEKGKECYKDWEDTVKDKKKYSSNPLDLAYILDAHIRAYDIPMPFFRYIAPPNFIESVKKKFSAYIPCIENVPYYSLKGHPGKNWLPSTFRGDKHPLIVVKKNDWWNIDIVVDFFTEYERLNARKNYDNSVMSKWKHHSKRFEMLQQYSDTIFEGRPGDIKRLKDVIYHKTKELSSFRPARCLGLLTCILDCSYENLRGLKWLDISSGWGDRLATACMCGMNYLGFDPNSNLFYGYQEMIQNLSIDVKQKCFVENYPFESSVAGKKIQERVDEQGLFDICLTSPPFFNIEIYNGENQSCSEYPFFNDWMVHFLLFSLKRAWDNLKIGGFLAVNLANIRNVNMVEPMILFCEDYLPGSVWEGIITFSGRGTRRCPGSIYVWKKDEPGKESKWDPKISRGFDLSFPALAQKFKERMLRKNSSSL